jgi:hypothetical protein
VTLPAGGGRLSAVAGKFRQIVEVLPSLRAGALGVFPMVALGDLDAERGPLILAATPGGAAATATLDFLVRGRR